MFHQFTPVATLPHRIFFSLNREGAKDAKGFLRVMGDVSAERALPHF